MARTRLLTWVTILVGQWDGLEETCVAIDIASSCGGFDHAREICVLLQQWSTVDVIALMTDDNNTVWYRKPSAIHLYTKTLAMYEYERKRMKAYIEGANNE